MPSSPSEAFIGVAGIGFGVLMVYASYRNMPLLGSDGILTKVFTSSKLDAGTPRDSAGTALGEIGGRGLRDAVGETVPPVKQGFNAVYPPGYAIRRPGRAE